MSDLKSLAADLMRYVQLDLGAFEEDYRTSPVNTHSLPALKFKKQELFEIWSSIEAKFRQIRETPEINNKETADSIKFERLVSVVKTAKQFYRTCTISVDEAIEKITLKNAQPETPKPQLTQPENSAAFSLPPVDIPIFSGDFQSWTSFRDLFNAIYGNNTRLSGVEKLFYLKQKTNGEAKEIVDNAPLTNDGFLIAWKHLVSQYDNRRMQINAHLKTLFNLPFVSTVCSASIRKLQRSINCCIANLNLLEIDTDH